ncbi:MAG TPA: NAD-dependent deacylase [Usitatibacteraceae bacterium]|nr:NAD-dependent deacylase [Usitatibacteraceae bacterium]HRA23950.1 NAD-dependent deacylase [Usitatibacteraceae bacterium]
MTDDIHRARELLDHATAVAVLTGAGISAESGIPTFRDALTGLWANFRPEDLATPEAFEANPKLVWDWYAWRRGAVANALPNAGHRALVAIERQCREHQVDFTLITQNVDGLHWAAGSLRVVELHGNIRRVKCFDQGHAVDRWEAGEQVPTCPQCGSLLRPDVVWFGEALPSDALAAAFAAARTCDLFFCVGTSTVVEPAASLPFLALESGARVIELNSAATPLTPHATVSLRGTAAQLLPALALQGQ